MQRSALQLVSKEARALRFSCLPGVYANCTARFSRRGFTDDESPTGSLEAPAESDRATSELEASTSSPEIPARRKGKRPTRAEKGSWVNNTGLLDEIYESAPVWPENRPVYDVQTQAPWLFEPVSPVIEDYKRLRAENPKAFEALLQPREEELPPRPGARKILQWECNVVFDQGPLSGEPHPLNKKVKCQVHLRDLQQEFRLSDKALQHIALICGPRYNPDKGLLTLTSEKYQPREENRLHIVQILKDLVKEGRRVYPNPEQGKDNETDDHSGSLQEAAG